MKKLLLLLYALLPMLAQGQLIDNPRAQIRGPLGIVVLYEAKTDVPKGTYPATESGYAKFNADVKAGLWNLTLDNGAIIPKGTKPPKVPPLPTDMVGPPWASMIYSMSGQQLTVEGAGTDLVKARFQLVDGTSITGINPDGVGLDDQTFFGFGDNSVANPSYPKKWVATFTPSIIGKNFRITAQKSDGTLFVKEYVPAAGANRVQLYVASGGGNTSPPTTTTTTTPTTPVTVAYDQSVESEAAQFSNSGQDVFAFDDGGSSGAKITCCFTNSSRYLDYSITGVPGTGSLTLKLTYQTNTSDPATASIIANGQTQSLALSGLGGGKATASLTIPVIAGTNSIRIAGNAGTFLQDKIQVFGSITTSSGGTTTPPSSNVTTTYPSYTVGLMLGNSITTYTASTVPTEWQYNNAMAVDAPQYDNAHIVEAALRTVNPAFKLYLMGQGSGLEQSYNSSDNQAVGNTITNIKSDITRDYPNTQFNPFIYNFGGENTSGTYDETKLRSMFDQVFANIPRPSGGKVIMRTSFYKGKDQTDAFVRKYCTEKGYDYVDLSDVQERSDLNASSDSKFSGNAGWAKHPGRAGHALIGSRMLDKLKITSSGGTTTPTTGAIPTLAGGWAEGSLSQLYALAPFTPSVNQASSWAPNTEQLLSNDYLTIGIRNSVGGTLTRTVDKRWGFNMVNSNSLGNDGQYGKEDGGREEDFSAYGHPNGGPAPPTGHPYNQDGNTTNFAVTGDDTGWNPVPGSSRALDRPTVDWFERRTVNGKEVIYTRCQPYHWSLPAGKSQTRRHAWHWLEDRVHKWVYVYENFRTDNQMIFEGRQQEGPMSHIVGDCYRQFVSFAANGVDPTEITVQPPYNRNQADTGDKLTSGSWIGAYDTQDRGYALITPYTSRMGGKQQIGQAGNEYSYSTSYICARLMMDFDTPTNVMVAGSKFVGYKSELLDYLRANPVAHRPFKYNFDGGLFQGWYTIDGPLKRVNGEAVFGLGAPKGYNQSERGAAKLISPDGHFVAAQMPVLYLNMAVSGTSQILIGFQKAGQAEGDVAANGQLKTVSVTGDGQYRTYAIDMSGVSNYNGIVSQFFVQNPIGYTVNGSESIKLGWFSAQNAKP